MGLLEDETTQISCIFPNSEHQGKYILAFASVPLHSNLSCCASLYITVAALISSTERSILEVLVERNFNYRKQESRRCNWALKPTLTLSRVEDNWLV